MEGKNFDFEELAADPTFRQAILTPDEASVQFWTKWRAQTPLHEQKYQEARLFLLTLREKYDHSMSELQEKQQLELLESKRLDSVYRQPGRRIGNSWFAAALVLLACGLGIVNYLNNRSTVLSATTEISAKKDSGISAAIGENMQSRVNNSEKSVTLVLADSSVVTLHPGSKLVFPAHFGADFRKVELVGDAFFEITPNPKKPFFVYAGESVVKVLGTSFRVREREGEIRVSVASGRVSVFRASDFKDSTNDGSQSADGLLLVKNEEAVLNIETKKLEKSLVRRGTELNGSAGKVQEFVFDDTSIADVFAMLEKTYGMEIVFDKDSSRNCPITTYFKDESLLERINTICQAVGATYRPDNGRIVVTGIDCTNF